MPKLKITSLHLVSRIRVVLGIPLQALMHIGNTCVKKVTKERLLMQLLILIRRQSILCTAARNADIPLRIEVKLMRSDRFQIFSQWIPNQSQLASMKNQNLKLQRRIRKPILPQCTLICNHMYENKRQCANFFVNSNFDTQVFRVKPGHKLQSKSHSNQAHRPIFSNKHMF